MKGGDLVELLKDPVTRVLLQHEERIRYLENTLKIGVGLAGAIIALLGGILTVLLVR